jgi:PqqD family protein of HPr-rel-A system
MSVAAVTDITTPEPCAPEPYAKRIRGSVHWREWEGEIVAYNDHTGDTHHFADLAAWLFRRLAESPATDAMIAAAAEDEIELPAAVDRHAALTRTIALFVTLDLLEAA